MYKINVRGNMILCKLCIILKNMWFFEEGDIVNYSGVILICLF